ncbi:hypothetical protein AnigIFM50267_010174 [Aspergillus niger]|nr:hypothetical protein AnigIFM50267_010174 [Aspergillus niger]
MLPPSESIRHQIHKLAESQEDSDHTNTIPPPPPYSPSTFNAPKEHEADNDGGTDQTSLISIHIDASMSIQGNANSIIIPSVTAPAPTHNPQTSSTLNPTSSSSSSTTAVPQLSQYQRHSKLTDMVTSIIAALHRTGRLDSIPSDNPATEGALADADGLPSSSITLNINTGIKILGSGNVICVGVTGQRRMGMNVLRRKRRACSEPPEVATAGPVKRAR